MPRGLFQMGTLGWTPAAQLATQNQSGAAASYASMDKAVNQTQTTKVSGGSSNIFGDILPVVGAGCGICTRRSESLGGNGTREHTGRRHRFGNRRAECGDAWWTWNACGWNSLRYVAEVR